VARRLGHIIGVLLLVFVLFEYTAIPFSFVFPRQFRRVQVLAIDGQGPGGRLFLSVRSNSNSLPESTAVYWRDEQSLKVGSSAWLMTADWNIKGPKEQVVTPWRLLTAIMCFSSLVSLVACLPSLSILVERRHANSRSTRTNRALLLSCFKHSAHGRPLTLSVRPLNLFL